MYNITFLLIYINVSHQTSTKLDFDIKILRRNKFVKLLFL